MNGFDAFLLLIAFILVFIALVTFHDELTRKKRQLAHIRGIGMLCIGIGALAYHLSIETFQGGIAWSVLTVMMLLLTIVVSFLILVAGRTGAGIHR